jgi:competence protein ComEA
VAADKPQVTRSWLATFLPVIGGIALSSLASAGAAAAATKRIEGVVNLNTAPPGVLALLPGVGPSKAESIVAYRNKRPFRTVDELVRIKGIGRKMVRALRPHLAVSGPITAQLGRPAPAGAPAPPAPASPPPPRPALLGGARSGPGPMVRARPHPGRRLPPTPARRAAGSRANLCLPPP